MRAQSGLLVLLATLAATQVMAQQAPGVSPGAVPSLTLAVAGTTGKPEALADPAAAEWNRLGAERVNLNRTPPLFDTDPPAELVIPFVDVRLARAGGRLFVHLRWQDRTRDAAELTEVPDTPHEERDRKEHTEASDRFFDAVAVMVPGQGQGDMRSPSLQMGDAAHPVTIYYWNAARGAMRMLAQGRGTTERSGESFPAHVDYQNGSWAAVLELPELPSGTPLAFAVWNGSQLDRDGRKYFSVWHWLE